MWWLTSHTELVSVLCYKMKLFETIWLFSEKHLSALVLWVLRMQKLYSTVWEQSMCDTRALGAVGKG